MMRIFAVPSGDDTHVAEHSGPVRGDRPQLCPDYGVIAFVLRQIRQRPMVMIGTT